MNFDGPKTGNRHCPCLDTCSSIECKSNTSDCLLSICYLCGKIDNCRVTKVVSVEE